MEIIAILDHDEHGLYIEDIPDEVIDSPEWSGEEDYINANYNIEHYSWDYITEALYLPEGENDFYEINFKGIADI